MKIAKQWIMVFLMGAFILSSIPGTARAAGTTKTVRLRWHDGTTGTGYYDPQDEGKTIHLGFMVNAVGTNERNEREKFGFGLDLGTGTIGRVATVKVGEDVTCDVSMDELHVPDGHERDRIFRDIKLLGAEIAVYPGDKNYVIYRDPASPRDGNLNLQVRQSMQMEADVKMETPDEIILDRDRSDMKVRYRVERATANGGWEAVKGEDNLAIQGVEPFEERSLENALDMRFVKDGAGYLFQNAWNAHRFLLYNVAGIKTNTYRLCAEWDGARKAELTKRYNLEMTGNDRTHWTLTLKSRIHTKTTTREEETNYETTYIDDPTLPIGETHVETQGVTGKETVVRTSYFIAENGVEEEVHHVETRQPLRQAVNAVVRRGTKKGVWRDSTPAETKAIIRIDLQEGTWADGTTGVKEYPVTVGDLFTLPDAPIRAGYQFLYWQGSKYNPGEKYLVTGDHTFTAVWEKEKKEEPEMPNADTSMKTPRGSILTPDEITKILTRAKKIAPAIPKAGVGKSISTPDSKTRGYELEFFCATGAFPVAGMRVWERGMSFPTRRTRM